MIDDFGNQFHPSTVHAINEQLVVGELRMGRIEGDVSDLRDDMTVVRRDLAANTEATQRLDKSTADLVEFLQAMKGMFKVLDWFGRMAKPIASIFALGTAAMALYAAWKGHK